MKSICIVTSEIVGPFKNGGIGTHCYYLAKYLSERQDSRLTIVYNGAIDNYDSSYWEQHFRSEFDAQFVWISTESLGGKPRSSLNSPWDDISRANYHYLLENHHDIILFQEMLGGGFRTIQAKEALGYFNSSILAVMVHSSWQWINESMQLFPAYGLPEMLTKYMERYSVEHCDILLSPSQYMLDWSSTDVDNIPDHTRVLPYLFDKSLEPIKYSTTVTELIFFGRLEQRKGLLLFLDSLAHIIAKKLVVKPVIPLPVFFMGKPGQTQDGNGLNSIERYRSALSEYFNLIVIDNLGHHEALDFLRTHSGALVVCPSLQDNSPFAIIENILLGTNLISCNTGGIPELFLGKERLANPMPENLSCLIVQGLSGELNPVNPAYTVEKAELIWNNFLHELIEIKASSFESAPKISGFADLEQNDGFTLGLIHKDDIDKSNLTAFKCFQAPENIGDPSLIPEICRNNSITHWVLLASGSSLKVGFDHVVLRALSSDSDSVWTCITGFIEDESLIHAPLGSCLEAILASNVLGLGMSVLPSSVIHSLNGEGLALLLHTLEDSRYFWSFLSYLTLQNFSLRVIPEQLVSSHVSPSTFLDPTNVYQQKSSIISSMSSLMPRWASRLLPYVVNISPSIGSDNVADLPPPSLKLKLHRQLQKLKRRYYNH